jgi:vesicle transport protein SEC22
MALFTLITRVSDGLPFMESTEAIAQQTKEQAKSISKRLDSRSEARLRVDCGGQVITYLVEEGLSFLVVTDAAYPQRLALSFLVSLHREFTAYMRQQDGEGWRQQLDTCARPYAYQGFTSAGLLQLRKDYADQNSSKAQRLAEELHDVHSIMRKNIQEVLQRGENLDRA